MKSKIFVSLLLLVSFAQSSRASTPTEAVEHAVNRLILVAADKESDDQTKKSNLTQIISDEIDFEAVSKRVVSKSWKKATEDQKAEFNKLFLTIMSDTYFVLLKNYSNEKVLFLKEQLKKTKKNEYAIVDTQIISGNLRIPVRYRLIKINNGWKIYDFIPEGISLINTYKKSYKSILKKKGMQGLLDEMSKARSKKS
ncbi:MAG: ABC transporter substrate-binding protein [Kangiellaceae bacterium]|nr:ABC transporter substrate-binding protein [Kangiellaceae bacterium]